MEDIEEILIEEDPGMFEESSSDDVILESFIESPKSSGKTKRSDIKFKPKPRHYCALCPLSYQSINMFNLHMMKHHPNSLKETQQKTYKFKKAKTFKCSFDGCTMTFENSAFVKDHLNIHKTLACSFCHSKFISQKKLDDHSRVCGVNSRYCCQICQVGFKTQVYLNNHISLIHKVQKKIVIYPSTSNINRNIVIEDSTSSLDDNVISIEDDNDYIKQEIEICFNCIECGSIFEEESDYRHHMDTHSMS